MKIENKTGRFTTNMEDVGFGELFRHGASIFIKTDEEDDSGWLCVDLETGEISVFYNDEAVEVVQGVLTITA